VRTKSTSTDYDFRSIEYQKDNTLNGSYSISDYETGVGTPNGYIITEPEWTNPFYLGNSDTSLFYYPSQIVKYQGPVGTPTGNDQVITFHDQDKIMTLDGNIYNGEISDSVWNAVWGSPYSYGYTSERTQSMHRASEIFPTLLSSGYVSTNSINECAISISLPEAETTNCKSR